MSKATALSATSRPVVGKDPTLLAEGGIPTAVYLRVSSDSQADTDRYGLVVQEAACRRYAVQNCLRIDAVFTDIISGASSDRTGLEQLQRHQPAFGLSSSTPSTGSLETYRLPTHSWPNYKMPGLKSTPPAKGRNLSLTKLDH